MFNFDLISVLSFHSIKHLNEVKLYCVFTFVSVVYLMTTPLRIMAIKLKSIVMKMTDSFQLHVSVGICEADSQNIYDFVPKFDIILMSTTLPIMLYFCCLVFW